MAYLSMRSLFLALCPLTALGQSSTVATTADATTSYRAIFTVPTDADAGQPVLPNIVDPEAVDVQTVCPGYTASNVQNSATGFMASLDIAGPDCTVYGNDIHNLTLTVEYQAADRLNIQIQPRYIGPENETWFILPETLVSRPASTGNASSSTSDFDVSWTNDPTFSFTVTRKSTNDTLFTTAGSKLVYEDQFVEFVSALPENYNLYGLGETIHGFRLGNNLTSESAVSHGVSIELMMNQERYSLRTLEMLLMRICTAPIRSILTRDISRMGTMLPTQPIRRLSTRHILTAYT